MQCKFTKHLLKYYSTKWNNLRKRYEENNLAFCDLIKNIKIEFMKQLTAVRWLTKWIQIMEDFLKKEAISDVLMTSTFVHVVDSFNITGTKSSSLSNSVTIFRINSFYGITAIFRKSFFAVMHDWVKVVGCSEVWYVTIRILIEVMYHALFNIFWLNSNIIVSIVTRLHMVKTKGMKKLMHYNSFPKTTVSL